MKECQALLCLQVRTTILYAVKAYCQGVQPAADGTHGQPQLATSAMSAHRLGRAKPGVFSSRLAHASGSDWLLWLNVSVQWCGDLASLLLHGIQAWCCAPGKLDLAAAAA